MDRKGLEETTADIEAESINGDYATSAQIIGMKL